MGYSGRSGEECLSQEGAQHVQMPWTVPSTKASASEAEQRQGEGGDWKATWLLENYNPASPTKILVREGGARYKYFLKVTQVKQPGLLDP